MGQFTGLLGVVVLLLIAFSLSSARRSISWRIVIGGVALQMVLAFLFLRFEPVVKVFEFFARVVTRIIGFADEGTRFLFGNLADAGGAWGFVFAVKVLPVIVFFASFMAVLYHLGVMQRVIAAVAWILRRTLGVTAVEATSAAANIFVGQTEAPLTIRPYIPKLTQSQLMAVMTGGFATIAGSVLAAYVGLLGGESEEARVLFAKHLITASVMSAPAGFVMAKLMVPETEQPREETLKALKGAERETRNVLDAAAAGATDGLKLALNVAAMLVAFVALLALINWPLSALSTWGFIDNYRVSKGLPEASLQNILGTALMPLAWLMGVAWHDCKEIASLLGQQVILTEFVAYLDLTRMIREGAIDSRSAQIATYALCGFANLPSIAIQIGGLSALAPERRADLARLGLRAMVAGALACWMTASIASVFIT